MASTITTLANHYTALAPEERMSAVLEALARQDELETQRLQDACPKRRYSAPDAHYTDRLLIALDAAAVAAIELRGIWGQLRALRWAAAAAKDLIGVHRFEADLTFQQGVQAGQERSRTASPDPKNRGQPDGCGVKASDADVRRACVAEYRGEIQERAAFSVGKHVELLEEAARISAADLAAAWEAYQQFCRTGPGVDPAVLLAARGLHELAGEVAAALAQYPDVRPDPSKVNVHLWQIARPWQLHFGQDEEAMQETSL